MQTQEHTDSFICDMTHTSTLINAASSVRFLHMRSLIWPPANPNIRMSHVNYK